MITRRDLMGAVLVSPVLGIAAACPARATDHAAADFERRNSEPIYSGIMALDDSMGSLGPGDLICLAGRPRSGKTLLSLQVAINVCQSCLTNVLFVTLHEPPAAIGRMAPTDDQPYLAYGELAEGVPLTAAGDEGSKARVWIMSASPADIPRIGRLVRRLRSSHPAGFGLVILDGWTSDPAAGSKTRVANIHWGELESINRADQRMTTPAPLSETVLAESRALARAADIPVLLGIRTARNSVQHLGPKPADLRHLREAVAAQATQTVWLHRPELYWEGARRHHLGGVVRVVGEHDRFNGAWPTRSLLRYDTTQNVFLSHLTWWDKPPRAQCTDPVSALALHDDLRVIKHIPGINHVRHRKRSGLFPRIDV